MFICVFAYRFIMFGIDKRTHPQVTLLIIITCIAGTTRAEGLSYWRAHLNNQAEQRKSFLVKDLYDSLQHEDYNINLSMRDFILGIRHYVREQTLDCIKTTTASESALYQQYEFERKNRYCGKIELNWEKSLTIYTYTYIIKSQEALLLFNFLLFDFSWSDSHCSKHGLFIINSATNETLCFYGKRLPWTMVLNTNSAVVIITTALKYQVSLFYSTLRFFSWVHDFSKHTDINLQGINPVLITDLSRILNHYANPYYFYIRVDPLKVIALWDSGVKSNLDIIMYDGPGISSRRMLQKHTTFITSGFSGTLQIILLRSYADYFIISILARKRSSSFSTDCFNQRPPNLPMSMVASASIKTGKICFHNFSTTYFFINLAINDFYFKDPRSHDNLYDCQYGGLFIHQPSSQKTISVCENTVNTIIYGDMRNFIMLLVWYPSYSYGSIAARLIEDHCITKHLQWSDHLEYNKIKISDKVFIYCQRIICPTHADKYETSGGKPCKIYLETVNQSFKMVEVTVEKMHMPIPCRGNHSTSQVNYNMSIFNSPNWPITRNKIINLSVNDSSFIYFDFMRALNISIPFYCDTTRPYLQFGVTLHISTCYSDTRTKDISAVYLGDKLQVTQACAERRLYVNPDKVTEYIYTLPPDEKTHTGIRAKVSYKECPASCRNYTFELTVLKATQKTVHRYTSPAGQAIFTGLFHEGFILKVIPPKRHCTIKSSCEIYVSFFTPLDKVGTFKGNVVTHGTQEWHMYSKRYISFDCL